MNKWSGWSGWSGRFGYGSLPRLRSIPSRSTQCRFRFSRADPTNTSHPHHRENVNQKEVVAGFEQSKDIPPWSENVRDVMLYCMYIVVYTVYIYYIILYHTMRFMLFRLFFISFTIAETDSRPTLVVSLLKTH